MNVLIFLATLFAPQIVQAILLKQPKDYNDHLVSGRIIGGHDAPESFAPYQVSLQTAIFRSHFCGGAIIDAHWILTASHCVTGREPARIIVATGSNQWQRPNATYAVDAIYTHCRHNRPLYHNDIALLHLSTAIQFNEKTKPIDLPTKQMQEDDEVILTGWGTVELYGETPDNLKMVKLKYMPHKKCKSQFTFDADDVDVGHICTFTKVGEGSCHGDSGGPLVSGGKLVGVVNWGYPCATGKPDMHASPYFYRDWIRRVMSGKAKCII
ncbi:chymotrypsin-2-like [Eurosta solidaginis]|uniref:chymotrypsin-2-like n=1 Tax=Eurosta solidaginis TaxID=178769 RepID=UPI003530D65D